MDRNTNTRDDRSKEIIERLNRAQAEIERSKRLVRASGYYNDRLEGTPRNVRDS
jgi:hypothetical protein